jgi:hypothetical protein
MTEFYTVDYIYTLEPGDQIRVQLPMTSAEVVGVWDGKRGIINLSGGSVVFGKKKDNKIFNVTTTRNAEAGSKLKSASTKMAFGIAASLIGSAISINMAEKYPKDSRIVLIAANGIGLISILLGLADLHSAGTYLE